MKHPGEKSFFIGFGSRMKKRNTSIHVRLSGFYSLFCILLKIYCEKSAVDNEYFTTWKQYVVKHPVKFTHRAKNFFNIDWWKHG